MNAREELRALAAEATPGPWHIECAHHGGEDDATHLVLGVMRDRYGSNSVSTDDHATAAYIAAASPDRITALLDDQDAAERERDRCHRAELAWMIRAERAEAQVTAVARVVAGWYPDHDTDCGCAWCDFYEEVRAALDAPADTPTEPDADERGAQ